MFDVDLVTGTNYWTPQLETLFGLEPGGFGGTLAHWQALVHPEDVARVSDCLVSAIKDVDGCELSGRLGAPHRAASSHVRQLLREQW